jgi:hypothetical protein
MGAEVHNPFYPESKEDGGLGRMVTATPRAVPSPPCPRVVPPPPYPVPQRLVKLAAG